MAWEPVYCEPEELTEYANADAADADWALLACQAASRAIDRKCAGRGARQFGLLDAPEARRYSARYSRSKGGWLVSIADLMTTVGLEVRMDTAGTGTFATLLPTTEFSLLAYDAAERGRPWERLLIHGSTWVSGRRGEVEVTARWGWTAVPDAVHEAALMQANRLFARRDSPYGIAGTPENGSELRLLSGLDRDVALLVADYRRTVWAR